MREIVFFLEEPSAREMLNGLLPRLVDENTHFRCIPFEGKQDLEKQLERRLRNWLAPNTCFVVMRDQDSEDCVTVKQRLTGMCAAAGKPDTLVRIVCCELESWYLGDLEAVESGLNMNGLAKHQQKAKFRAPDNLQNPKQELKRLTNNSYQQIAGSREIGRHMALAGNRSNSFNVFISGVARLLNQEAC